jgi:hypothetical protein
MAGCVWKGLISGLLFIGKLKKMKGQKRNKSEKKIFFLKYFSELVFARV